MDPTKAGKLGGRPSKADVARKATLRDVSAGKQSTLSFVTHFTFNAPVTFAGAAALGSGAGGGAGAAAAASGGGAPPSVGSRRRRSFDEEPDGDDDDDDDDDDAEEGGDDEGEEAEDDGGGAGAAGAAAAEGAGGDFAVELPPRLSTKRHQYTAQQKAAMLAVLAREDGNQCKAARAIQKIPGYEKVDRTQLGRWQESATQGQTGAGKKRGRRVNVAFEKAVLSFLVYQVLTSAPETEDGEQHARVVANVAYSYVVIKSAATLAKALPMFAVDPAVQKLQLSNKWVVGFLRRSSLRRRRVTAVDKELPAVEAVRARMQAIQKVIKDGGYEPQDVISADETGIFFGAPPKNQ